MSRLQVGGLALIVHSQHIENVGRVVKLEYYQGCVPNDDHGDYWRVLAKGLTVTSLGITFESDYSYHPTKYLIPLGDKQTQDELAKEKENDPITSDAL